MYGYVAVAVVAVIATLAATHPDKTKAVASSVVTFLTPAAKAAGSATTNAIGRLVNHFRK